MKTADIVLTTTTTLAALTAGLFYAYSCSVILGLGKLSDIEYLKAMQSINKEIQNPVFFATFIGSLPMLLLNIYLHKQEANFWLLLAATVIYFVGVFGVTGAGNVPLNNTLENFNILSAENETITTQRRLFENKWNVLNHIRSICATITVVLLVIACIYKYRSREVTSNQETGYFTQAGTKQSLVH